MFDWWYACCATDPTAVLMIVRFAVECNLQEIFPDTDFRFMRHVTCWFFKTSTVINCKQLYKQIREPNLRHRRCKILKLILIITMSREMIRNCQTKVLSHHSIEIPQYINVTSWIITDFPKENLIRNSNLKCHLLNKITASASHTIKVRPQRIKGVQLHVQSSWVRRN